jgi:very-short-patch-repair endonuclease
MSNTTGLTKEYLKREYELLLRSPYEIAKEVGCHPNTVRRALIKYGFRIRTRSEAQRLALGMGRRENPAKDPETKAKISESMAAKWEQLSDEERAKRVAGAKVRWEAMSDTHRGRFDRNSRRAIVRAGSKGSKLEKALMAALRQERYTVLFHKKGADLFLKYEDIAIVIDGPSHFLPLYGEEALAKAQAQDRDRERSFRRRGFKFIRIKNMARNMTQAKAANACKNLLAALPSVLNSLEREVTLEVN